MKRRQFLAASALFSLFSGGAQATTTKKKKTSSKKKKKSSSKVRKSKPASNAQTPRTSVRSAAAPLIDNPPDGTSASRLPPVKAQELPAEWRTHELTIHFALNSPGASASLWLPMPSAQETLFQRTISLRWQGNTSEVSAIRKPDGELEMLRCEWANAENARLTLVSQVVTSDRQFDITRRSIAPERDDILRHNLQATSLIPNGQGARQLGEEIVGRIKDPLAQAKAIYDWICENAIYDPTLPGCGSGNIQQQIESRRFGGRSADINGLFVSICRAIGIPARCVYGLRIGRSRLFPSLGLRSDDATRAQHVRAEFYLPGYAWIAVDPSDVRRAIAYEQLAPDDARLASLKRVLFGVWEMNWVAFHHGNDLRLNGLGQSLPFFIHPQLRLDGLTIDPLAGISPLRINARQITLS